MVEIGLSLSRSENWEAFIHMIAELCGEKKTRSIVEASV